jgi:hypothetical protein
MRSNSTVKTSTIILASILLAGVIALTYGFYKSSPAIIYGSLIIIFPVSLMLPLQNILFKKKTGRKFSTNQ